MDSHPQVDFEVIVVGGGLAGLSAGIHLRDRRCLLLEAERHVGGRLSTGRVGSRSYERGALFAVGAGILPEGAQLPRARPDGRPLALSWQGQLRIGASAFDCVVAAGATSREQQAIRHWEAGQLVFGDLSARCRRILQGFFNAIHPGDIPAYLAHRQRDALVRFQPSYRPGGNAGALQAYRRACQTTVLTSAAVLRIENHPRGATVHFRHRGRPRQAKAKAVVVATPAITALRLIERLHPQAERFLGSVEYGAYTTVTLAARLQHPAAFSCLVLPEDPQAIVYSQPQQVVPSLAIFTVYFADRISAAFQRSSDTAVARATLRRWRQAGLDDLLQTRARVVEVKRWRAGGTILGAGAPRSAHGGPSVALAGDYTWPWFPFGTRAAVRSGERAAKRVRGWLDRRSDGRRRL